MTLKWMALLILGATLQGSTLLAQSTTFTQVGSLGCYDPGGGSQACAAITFPQKFGGVPSVIAFAAATLPYVHVAVTNLTDTGFTPVVNADAFRPYGPGFTTAIYWVATGPVLLGGSATAKYLVLTVIYAPPGTNGGKSSSSVSYAAGSTTGTTTSASQSFKAGNTLSFETSASYLGTGGSLGLSFGYSQSNNDSQSLEIKKSVASTINRQGPSQDGINHDEDAIYLLLNPAINLALTSSSAVWTLGDNSKSPVQYVYVGWLNGHMAMPGGVATALQSAGISATDYPDILARDPLANGASASDTPRFLPLNSTFPYEPPLTSTDPVPTITYIQSDTTAAAVGSEIDDTYTVGLTLKTGAGFLGFAETTFKDTTSWEWTNKSSHSSTTGTSQSASVTIGGPAYGYSGPTVMQVYIDTMYQTFAFEVVPVTQLEVGINGTLVDAAGKPLPQTEVTLVEKGITHRTFTNGKGEYTFFGSIRGPVTVQADGVPPRVVPQAAPPRNLVLRKQ